MNTAITVAIIAGAVSALGWLVTSILSNRNEIRRRQISARLEYVQKQLEELYGPLAFLVYEGRFTWEDLLATLGRQHVFDGDHIPEKELPIWLHWVETEAMPRNFAIQALLAGKSHLIEGSTIPNSYLDFLDHHNSWRVRHSQWKELGTTYSWHSRRNWPEQFEADVIEMFWKLRKEYEQLIGAIGRKA
ncbi:hypothetical protein EJK15_17780 [Nonomuraea basaltis]|nr:hypothetical protein EJK15_17780 [Nonomuraea basaltis]